MIRGRVIISVRVAQSLFTVTKRGLSGARSPKQPLPVGLTIGPTIGPRPAGLPARQSTRKDPANALLLSTVSYNSARLKPALLKSHIKLVLAKQKIVQVGPAGTIFGSELLARRRTPPKLGYVDVACPSNRWELKGLSATAQN